MTRADPTQLERVNRPEPVRRASALEAGATTHASVTEPELMNRREAILRVTALLGGVALVGGDALLTGRGRLAAADAPLLGAQHAALFSAQDVAFLEELADTILPETTTPGAKAVQTGAFMALIVTDSYDPRDQEIFLAGMRTIDEATRAAHGVSFMEAPPRQRLAVLEAIDREQKAYSDIRRERLRERSMAYLSDQRQEAAPAADVGPAAAITADSPAHYFRMMKELALLGYFTSEVGCMQAQRYIETPGRFDPCVPYEPGERAWAPHA